MRPLRATSLVLGSGLLAAALLFSVQDKAVAQDDSKVTPLIERNAPSGSVIFQEGMNIAPLARATIFVRDIEESLKL